MAEKTSIPEPDSEINKFVYVRRDDGSYGGWRTELLVEEITEKVEAKFLLCNYCRGMLRDAYLFEKDGKQDLRCSVCTPKDVNKRSSQLSRETVNEKQIYCPLKNKGCDWTNELNELLNHLQECELFPVACPLGCRDERGEVIEVERRGIETHRTCCPMRTVKCEYCSIGVKACFMTEHLEVCIEFPIPCPNKCSEEFRVKRKKKSIHLSQECPLQETECPYSQYGCEVKVQRRMLEQHEKEDVHKHLKFTVSKVARQDSDNEVLRMKILYLEKENEELKRKDLERQSSLATISSFVLKGNLELKIDGVKAKICQKEDSYSDPFYVGLYKFQGLIQWNRTECYVGVFLHIMKGEWDDTLKWPIRYKYSMVLTNQLDAKDNYEMKGEITEESIKEYSECFSKPSTERNDGLGQPEFIPHADLLQKKYSKHDKITLKISVELI